MKYQFPIQALFLLILLLSGCMKDYEAVDELSFKADGELVTANSVSCHLRDNRESITITAFLSKTDNSNLSINLKANRVGTYVFTNNYLDGRADIITYPDGWYFSNTTKSPEGQVVITKYDTTNWLISGTFSFVAYKDSVVRKVITEGKFKNLRFYTF
jgi:hypothetical protein